MQKIKVSIIIPAWHEKQVIIHTLNSIDSLDYPLGKCEVIVVASEDDGTFNIAKNYRSRFGDYVVLRQGSGGKNSALQQGIKSAKGDIIVLLDADTLVEKNWLSELTKPLDEGYCCVNGNWFPLKKSWLNKYFLIEKVWGRQILRQQSTHGGGGIAFKRVLLDEKGGIDILFNKNISVGVDHYFGEQLLKKRYEIYFAEKAKAKTLLNNTFKGFVKNQLRWNKGYVKLITPPSFLKTALFNALVFFSPLLFILSALNSFWPLSIPLIAYLSLLLVQCCAVSFNMHEPGFIKYAPIYMMLNFIDRTITSYVFVKSLFISDKNEYHFKGER